MVAGILGGREHVTAIIIPACNESARIDATLQGLLSSIDDDVEVIVVCNGCTDDTADHVRQFAPRIRLAETKVASKTYALNLGDEAASSFPRIYLDADVIVSTSLVTDLVRALDEDRPLVAYSSVTYDLTTSSMAVRAFYGVWQSLPYNRPGRIGVGLYALNEQGRERFCAFPEIISDDGFVRGHFSEAECLVVSTCRTTVRAPETLASLVKIKTRSRLGLYQLRDRFPHVLRQHRSSAPWRFHRGSVRELVGLPVYLVVNALTRARAAHQRRSLDVYRWERDESTRRGLALE